MSGFEITRRVTFLYWDWAARHECAWKAALSFCLWPILWHLWHDCSSLKVPSCPTEVSEHHKRIHPADLALKPDAGDLRHCFWWTQRSDPRFFLSLHSFLHGWYRHKKPRIKSCRVYLVNPADQGWSRKDFSPITQYTIKRFPEPQMRGVETDN